MNKKIIIIKTILFLFCMNTYIYKQWHLFIFASLLLTIFIFVILANKSPIKSRWMKELDLLKDKRRNYNTINIGYSIIDDEGLDLTVKHSNLYSDYLLLQRYYSLGKKGCTIKFNMKNTPSYFDNSNTISLFVLNMLHDVTVLENGTCYYSYKIKWGCLFNSLLYIFYNVYNYLQVVFFKNNRVNDVLVNEINGFAHDRGLIIDWYINGKKWEF